MVYHMEIDWMGSNAPSALRFAAENGRDKCRTPMAWANATNTGFCPAGVTPWLPVNLDYAQGANVVEQLNDPDSLLSFYKKMLPIRKNQPALIWGNYKPLYEEATGFLAFLRIPLEQKCLVVLNMLENPQSVHLMPG